MNDQFQNNEPLDRREARRQRREERREALGIPGGSTWAVGLVLIILGGVLLMQNIGVYKIPFTNWWALFILIPALGSLDRAYRAYKHADNQLTAFARNSMFVGLILTMVAGMFLLNLNWSIFGPIFIILVGLGILTKNMFSSRE